MKFWQFILGAYCGSILGQIVKAGRVSFAFDRTVAFLLCVSCLYALIKMCVAAGGIYEDKT